jgi:hypothetical protein
MSLTTNFESRHQEKAKRTHQFSTRKSFSPQWLPIDIDPVFLVEPASLVPLFPALGINGGLAILHQLVIMLRSSGEFD